MRLNRRKFLTLSATAILSAGLLGPQSAFAEGGEDPIPGIDVIIEKDPSVEPITHFSLNGRQIKRFNRLKGAERSRYLAAVIVDHLAKKDLIRDRNKAVARITQQLGESWCGPCRMLRGKRGPVRKLHIRGREFREGISAMISAKF